MRARYGTSVFAISGQHVAASTARSVVMDGVKTAGDTLTLIDDGGTAVVLARVPRRH